MSVEVQSCKSIGMVECPRCWHWHYATLNLRTTDERGKEGTLCNRCVAIICKHHKEHESYALILENLEERFLKPEDNPEWEAV